MLVVEIFVKNVKDFVYFVNFIVLFVSVELVVNVFFEDIK